MTWCVKVWIAAAMVMGVGACTGDDGMASASDSASGSSSGGETTTTTTGESEAGSASESDSSTTSGASEGQTNTTDLSGSNSDSNSGTSTTTDTDGGSGSSDTTESGGGSGGTSTTTTSTTGDPVQCADHQDQKSCEADPKCQSILGTNFKYIISAWCLGDDAFLGCTDVGEFCGGDPLVVCQGDQKYLLTNTCPPPDAPVCEPPPGGPDYKACG